jgi:endoglucanase
MMKQPVQKTLPRLQRLFIILLSVLFLIVSGGSSLPSTANKSAKIVVNQIGFLPNSSKVAFLVNSDITNEQIELVDSSNQKTVKVVVPSKPHQDTESKDFLQTIDFSQLQQNGQYFLRAGSIQSTPFRITPNVYQDSLVKLLHSFYLQRCGVAINDSVTGIRHTPCHLHDGAVIHRDAINSAGQVIPTTGGWHDAGDYGKYVSTTAVTIGRLLSLYEATPGAFPDRQLAIPESGNGIPDLLDEMRVGLDWMIPMQRLDGAVYRKLSGKKWPPIVAPNEDIQPRFLYGISTPETAKFAAAMAIAARVYASWQPAQSKIYLMAAQRAWTYLQQQPLMQVDWVDGDDSGSGKYLESDIDKEPSLKIDTDDRFWAAAELFATTRQPQFEEYVAQQLPKMPYSLFEWKDPSALGMVNYLRAMNQSINRSVQSQRVILQITSKIKERADTILQQVQQSGYRLANHQFIWGSNKMTAEEGITLMLAYQMTKNSTYLQGAIDQIDYLLGRNPFNQTFVTGVGTRPVQNVHHIFARARKIMIPGLLVGGANSGAQDNIAPKNQGILSYIDDERSYATNEYAIDYNASLITLLGMVATIE